MTRQLLEGYVKAYGRIDRALVEFGLAVLASLDPAEIGAGNRFNPRSLASLAIYLGGNGRLSILRTPPRISKKFLRIGFVWHPGLKLQTLTAEG